MTGADIRHDPAFRQLWWAQGLSLVGSEAYDFTLLLLTAAAYGAVLSVGWLGAAMTAGALLLGPVLSTLQDRAPRRRGTVMRYADFARAGLTVPACLVLALDAGPAVVLYAIVVALTVLDVVFQAGLRASLPRLLAGRDPGQLGRANSSLLSQWSIVQVVVPPLSAAALAVVEPWVVILFDGVTFTASGLMLRRYAARVAATYDDPSPAPAPPVETPPRALRWWAEAREGVCVVLRDRCVAHLLGAYAVANAITFAVLLSVPTLVQRGGTVDEVLVGVSLAGLSLGSFVGSRAAGRVRGPAVTRAVLLADPFARAVALVGVAAAGRHAVVVAPLLALGACIGLSNVVRLSFVQGRFADAVMGRVMSAYAVANQLFLPVAALGWSLARDAAGLRGSYVVLAAVSLASALVLLGAPGVRTGWRVEEDSARARA